MRGLWSVLLAKYYAGDNIKELSAPDIWHIRAREDVRAAFGRQIERDHFEGLGLEGRTILKCVFQK